MGDLEETVSEESSGLGLKGKIGAAILATTIALSSMTMNSDNPVPEAKPRREIYDKNGDVLSILPDEQPDYDGALSSGDVSELFSEYDPQKPKGEDLFSYYANSTEGLESIEMPRKDYIALAAPDTLQYIDPILNSPTPVAVPANPYTAEDEDLLARLICAEARGDTVIGMQAVGRVVVLRMKDYGQTLEEVIFAPGQFTPAKYLSSVSASPDCIQASHDVLFNGADPFDGSVSYHFSAGNGCPGNEVLVAENVFCP
jgi:spore germination cell wall hydrolase CwlJ-like protein